MRRRRVFLQARRASVVIQRAWRRFVVHVQWVGRQKERLPRVLCVELTGLPQEGGSLTASADVQNTQLSKCTFRWYTQLFPLLAGLIVPPGNCLKVNASHHCRQQEQAC